MSEDIFVTISGFGAYYGTKVFKIGKIIRLSKERDNNYDSESIRAEIPYFGKVGYVANSIKNKARGTVSAGYIYNLFDEYCYAKIMFATTTKIIVKIVQFDRNTEIIAETNHIS